MKLKINLIALLCLIVFASQAQIWPQPQQVQQKSGYLNSLAFRVKSKIKIDETNLALAKSILPINDKHKKANLLNIQYFKKNDADNKGSGAYTIEVNEQGITIAVADQRSIFYALKTLAQMVQRKAETVTIAQQHIADYADVTHRGVVEGFYGTPWSLQDRINQLNFYGNLKLNTYIYGPKDDPYHSSPHWRDEYPADKAQEIKQLVDVAKRNYVDFVWAIHPGKDIKWNKADSLNLLNKFEKMYALGVRAFAVFFDDISGEGTNPVKQADLLNFLHHSFVKKHQDVNAFILCPTEYNKSWANPKPGTYLDILGDQLDPSIQVMWTGNRVIADIDMPSLDWINKRLKRKAYIWWNFPVSDYVRNHLLMGPAYGNTLDIAQDMSGFVSNPMEHAEASKIALYGVAGYTWNMQKYQPDDAFYKASEYIMPEAAASLRIFAENNSDLGPNGHGYRRTETVRMAPQLNALKAALPKPNNSQLEPVIRYFDSIAQAPTVMIAKAQNRNLIKEMMPWLSQFELLGKAGITILQAYKNETSTSIPQQWEAYLNTHHLLGEMKNLNQTQNQNPYQPGVATGSLVLYPFVIDTFNSYGKRFLTNQAQENKAISQEKLLTNVPQIQNQPVQSNEKSVSISPILEPVQLAPKAYFGLSWLDNRTAKQLNFNFDSNNFADWGIFETSTDGITWQKHKTSLNAKSKNITLDPNVYFVRFVNSTDSTQQIFLKQFNVQTQENTNSTNINLLWDNNLSTSVQLAGQQSLKITLKNNKAITILLDSQQQEVQISAGNKPNIYRGTANYIQISSEQLKGAKEIILKNLGGKALRIFELQQP
jgi:hyaluronoglucosaminidase